MENKPNLNLLGLASIAILPDYERRGIGFFLTQYSLRESAARGIDAVVVLGNPHF